MLAIGTFICPSCAEGALAISSTIALGGDDESDDRSLQILSCRQCSFEGVAAYEASRRGGDERFHHSVFVTLATPMIKSTIAECAAPSEARCHCFAHQLLRKQWSDPSWQQKGHALALAR